MKKLCLVATIALLATSAFAQVTDRTPPGTDRLTTVSGNVSVVQNGQFTIGVSGSALADGARVVAGTNGATQFSITLENRLSCDVNLTSGQAFTVNKKATACNQLIITNVSQLADITNTTGLAATGAEDASSRLGIPLGRLLAFAFIGLVAYESISPR